jgi:hypothetical protein
MDDFDEMNAKLVRNSAEVIAELEEENALLMAALRPFAALGCAVSSNPFGQALFKDQDPAGNSWSHNGKTYTLAWGDMRRAYSAFINRVTDRNGGVFVDVEKPEGL